MQTNLYRESTVSASTLSYLDNWQSFLSLPSIFYLVRIFDASKDHSHLSWKRMSDKEDFHQDKAKSTDMNTASIIIEIKFTTG